MGERQMFPEQTKQRCTAWRLARPRESYVQNSRVVRSGHASRLKGRGWSRQGIGRCRGWSGSKKASDVGGWRGFVVELRWQGGCAAFAFVTVHSGLEPVCGRNLPTLILKTVNKYYK